MRVLWAYTISTKVHGNPRQQPSSMPNPPPATMRPSPRAQPTGLVAIRPFLRPGPSTGRASEHPGPLAMSPPGRVGAGEERSLWCLPSLLQPIGSQSPGAVKHCPCHRVTCFLPPPPALRRDTGPEVWAGKAVPAHLVRGTAKNRRDSPLAPRASPPETPPQASRGAEPSLPCVYSKACARQEAAGPPRPPPTGAGRA